MVFDITNYSRPFILIFVGLPGTGKTTYVNYCRDCLKERHHEDDLQVITRDKIRCDILKGPPPNNPPEPDWKRKNLDEFVDRIELFYITLYMSLEHFRHKIIILDGCHTNYHKLKAFLEKLNEINYGKTWRTQIMLFGDYNSTCAYDISDKQEGDYSDYNLDTFAHSSIPKIVIERKRRELKELYEHMDELKELVDQVCECDVK